MKPAREWTEALPLGSSSLGALYDDHGKDLLIGSSRPGTMPALPGAWPEGTAKGLRARGAVTVDLHWKEGKLAAARITAKHPGRYTIRHGGKSATLDLQPGLSVQLGPGLVPQA